MTIDENLKKYVDNITRQVAYICRKAGLQPWRRTILVVSLAPETVQDIGKNRRKIAQFGNVVIYDDGTVTFGKYVAYIIDAETDEKIPAAASIATFAAENAPVRDDPVLKQILDVDVEHVPYRPVLVVSSGTLAQNIARLVALLFTAPLLEEPLTDDHDFARTLDMGIGNTLVYLFNIYADDCDKVLYVNESGEAESLPRDIVYLLYDNGIVPKDTALIIAASEASENAYRYLTDGDYSEWFKNYLNELARRLEPNTEASRKFYESLKEILAKAY